MERKLFELKARRNIWSELKIKKMQFHIPEKLFQYITEFASKKPIFEIESKQNKIWSRYQ
jgi:hypothetical protein